MGVDCITLHIAFAHSFVLESNTSRLRSSDNRMVMIVLWNAFA